MDSASTILGLVPGYVVEGKYELVRRIGHGGMGTVWEARSVALGRTVALKFLHPEMSEKTTLVQRFLREARAAANVTHPSVVYVFDVGWVGGGKIPYFAMEYLEGKSLAGALRASGPFEVGRAVSILCRVLEALDAAHAKGVVHRDLKPENVFLVRQGSDEIVKVLDFGISKVVGGADAALTGTGVILGTPSYMSPEQVRCSRDVDARCDLYSAGAILYELLAGGPAFAGGSFTEVVYRILNDPPRPLPTFRPGIDGSVVRVIERALMKDPADRWQSAAEMRAALLAATVVESQISTVTVAAKPQAPQQTPLAWDSSSPARVPAIGDAETVTTPVPLEHVLPASETGRGPRPAKLVWDGMTTSNPSEDGPTTALPLPAPSAEHRAMRRGPNVVVLAVAAVAAVVVGGGAALLLRASGGSDHPPGRSSSAPATPPLLPPPTALPAPDVRASPVRPEPLPTGNQPPRTTHEGEGGRSPPDCRIQITVSPTSARVRIDGAPLDAPVDLPAACGSLHSLRVEATGHRPVERMIEVGEQNGLEIRLDPLGGRAKTAPRSPRLEPNPF